MASYAEYSAQTMASNDFTLYPDAESWNQEQSYLPTSTYAEQPYLGATTFDSFPAQTSFAHQQYSEFRFDQAAEQAKDRFPSPAQSTSHSFDHHNPPHFSATSDSGHSTISSAMGSPSAQVQSSEWNHHLSLFPDIVQHSDSGVFAAASFEYDTIPVTDKGCVDPSLIQPFSPSDMGTQFAQSVALMPSPHPMAYHSMSPVPSRMSSQDDRSASVKPQSPYQTWQPYPHQQHNGRRPSLSSVHSRHSQNSHSSEDSNKGLCPIATCGRHVKDLKAHMLTHQQERPEKCPIPTCEYHIKGFARKYDKSRHTLTHYKGTMVCGFCPGSGSAAEKSFNRADVFKRHLTSVHGVEQTPPNSRRKSPITGSKKASGVEVSGMCSTCGNTFANAQDFYEHLDDCVLRVVQQAEPSEANNEKLLSEISRDKECQQTLEKHHLPTEVDPTASTDYDQEEEMEDDDEEDDTNDGTYGKRKTAKGVGKNGAILKPGQKKGLTLSKNGAPLAGSMTGKGSKRRKNYPLSWGAAPDKMRMKKRVLCVFDGPRRLWKDDLMLDAEHEVRIPLNADDAHSPYVTDLDVLTLRRAEGVLNATEEEKGPWQDEEELQRLMES